jgi:tripartite-type tricarboxylate transporter receptor subunit TctC
LSNKNQIYIWVLLVAVCFLGNVAVASAETINAMTINVGFPAGGPVDIAARNLAASIEKTSNTKVTVTNIPGGNGTKAIELTLQTSPENNSLVLANMAALAIQPQREKLSFRTPDDYKVIANVVANPACLIVKNESSWQNVNDFISAAKERPQTLRLGVIGNHVLLQPLQRLLGIELVAVSFNGAGALDTALKEGKIDAAIQHHMVVLEDAKNAKVRVLGVFEDERSTYFPAVPTFAEMGYDITFDNYLVLVASKSISADRAEGIVQIVRRAKKAEVFAQTMMKMGMPTLDEEPYFTELRLIRDASIFSAK